MKQKFSYQHIHACEAAVIHCVDFRFRNETAAFIEKHLGIKTHDLWTMPGAAKAIVDEQTGREYAKLVQRISGLLHHIEKVAIINHADCGAYGGRKAFETIEKEQEAHVRDLCRAREILRETFNDQIEILLGYADLSKDGNEVIFSTVK